MKNKLNKTACVSSKAAVIEKKQLHGSIMKHLQIYLKITQHLLIHQTDSKRKDAAGG